MTDYEFRARDAAGVRTIARMPLASDIDASIRSFDLMRRQPGYFAIEVYADGGLVFQRRRVAEKLPLEWADGFPRRVAPPSRRRRVQLRSPGWR